MTNTHHQQKLKHQRNMWVALQKWGYPQIIHFNGGFHYKPSILGYPYLWKHPCKADGLYLTPPDTCTRHHQDAPFLGS